MRKLLLALGRSIGVALDGTLAFALACGLAICTGAATILSLTPAPAHADVSAFGYDSWHVDYRIDTDRQGRAVARVTETVEPRFPDFDQNRGIVRGIPIDYEGASTDPRDITVTDAQGDPVPFEIEEEDGFRAILVGDDSYVHGLQHYVIGYTLSDVVLARDDGEADEFYWDLMDFEHLQPVESFSAEIRFSPKLAAELNGDARCYAGAAESTAECAIETGADGSGAFTVPSIRLQPRQGATVAIGLQAGSVAQPPVRLPNFALDVLPLIVGGAGLAVAGTGAVAISRMRRKRRTARGTIVAQYDVPAWFPPLIAGPLIGASASPVPAEIVHLAVNGAARIEDGEPEQGFFGAKAAQTVIRALDPARAADPLDAQTLEALIPGSAPGAAVILPKQSTAFAAKMTELRRHGDRAAAERGYFERVRSPLARRLGFVALALAAVLAVLAALGFATRNSATPVIAAIGCVVVVLLACACLARHRVHTRAGAEAREYLEGVREFIRVAESDRLQVLQSYSGAERREDGGVDVIHLYEKLLPYAMLFSLEKEWGRVLETRYQEQPGYVPLWYPAVASRGFADFPSTLSRFTGSLSSSVSYTSSSSGGSSGGGFAGGGGGGGFSGGR